MMLILFPFVSQGQGNNMRSSLSQKDIGDFKQQSEQLVKFMEFSFNSLGNSKISAREKEVIINESYLKFFASDKVQIEDDLIEGRFTVTNKNVQAYLKDIDFFFRQAVFTYTIEAIDYNVNNLGNNYFLVTTTRNLKGIGTEGDTIYNNLTRYIEINLDPDKRDLKIASIYTNKLNEKEDMHNWWISLSSDWRSYFAKDIFINNEYHLRNITDFSDKWLAVERYKVSVIDDLVMEYRKADTIKANTRQIYQEISRIWKTESVDISNQAVFTDIEPLSKLTELRSVNLSGNPIDDLTPIRNLTRLESILIDGTAVTRLDPLRHSVSLKFLDASNTAISDLSLIPSFTSLERLYLSNTNITGLDALAGLNSLRDLKVNGTLILSLAPLENIQNLNILDISNTMIYQLEDVSKLKLLKSFFADNTKIADLEPLASLNDLQYLFIEGTNITNIQMLANLPSLKRIYCDRTKIKREQANKFMQDNPDVLVIYESQTLTDWWATLPQIWKDIFREIVPLSDEPTREELHEVANISRIAINGRIEIFDLTPLNQLPRLRILNASNTGISNIEALRENIELTELDISSTGVSDISVLAGHRSIETLNFSHTTVESILPLGTAQRLKYVDMDHTPVKSLKPFNSLNNLETVLCDNTRINRSEISGVYESNPDVTVVFQTDSLTAWWHSLPSVWKNIFEQHIAGGYEPSRIELHKLTDIKELDLNKIRGIQNLDPLIYFHRLQVLKMSDLAINDISVLENFKNLRELDCSNNPINNIKSLGKLFELTTLDCSNTLLRNLNDLKNLRNLEILNIAGTQVSALKPLGNHTSLRQLDCNNTKIISLRPLENLKELELLRCYNTRVIRFFVNRFKSAVPGCEVVYY